MVPNNLREFKIVPKTPKCDTMDEEPQSSYQQELAKHRACKYDLRLVREGPTLYFIKIGKATDEVHGI
jgi:hypothetical protein